MINLFQICLSILIFTFFIWQEYEINRAIARMAESQALFIKMQIDLNNAQEVFNKEVKKRVE